MPTPPSARRSAFAPAALLLLLACGDDGTGPGDAPENTLELPEVVAGTTLELSTFEGTALVDTTAAWQQALASLGVSASDLSLSLAVAPESSELSLQVAALTVRGVDWSARLEVFADEIAADGVVTIEERSIATRIVHRAHVPGDPFAAYYYAVGDMLFTIWTDDEGVAAEVLGPLGTPESPATAARARAHPVVAAAARSAVASPGAGAIMLTIATRPIPPVCVGEPHGRHSITAMTMVLSAAGPFPDPFVRVSAAAVWGDVRPPLSVGFFHGFAYASTAFGAGTAEVVDFRSVATMSGQTGTDRIEFPVQQCLGGRWVDGPRILSIEQLGNLVTAGIESGTLVCGAAGVAFSGLLEQDRPIATIEGTDLKVCNPPDCVEEGLLEEAALVPFRLMVADDGMSADIEWTETLFDAECLEDGTAQNTFSISRLTFETAAPAWSGPARPL